jgi:CubicO group peptidase (beta-lactamase class C family)
LLYLALYFIAVIVVTDDMCWAQADEKVPADGKALRDDLDRIARESAEASGFSGVVHATIRGEVVASLAFGQRDSQTGEPNTPETLFEIASVTKPVTAIACLRLVELGKLNLDDPIAKHLPGVPPHAEAITVRHLIQHTSGMPGDTYGPYTRDAGELVAALLVAPPAREPGQQHEYWNQGYALLAAIIAKTSGKSYEDAVAELVFRPAGMKSACFTGQSGPDGMAVAVGESDRGPRRSALDPPYGDFYGLQYQGMGGAVCSAGELATLVAALRGGKLLSDNSSNEMLRPGPDGFALGWRVKAIGDQQRRVSHTGGVRGFVASLDWYPDDQVCLVVLANHDDGRRMFAVAEACRKRLEQEFVRSSAQRVFSAERVAALEGEYAGRIANGRDLVLTIKASEGNTLAMTIDWGGGLLIRGVLEQGEREEELKFVDQSPEALKVKVDAGEDGKAAALETLNAKFPRRPK